MHLKIGQLYYLYWVLIYSIPSFWNEFFFLIFFMKIDVTRKYNLLRIGTNIFSENIVNATNLNEYVMD